MTAKSSFRKATVSGSSSSSAAVADLISAVVLVLDFGSQYSKLIVRRLREIGIFSELCRCDSSLEEIEAYHPAAVILSGGPSSVYEGSSPHVAAGFFEWAAAKKLPVLGICYGMQEMCYALGGEVEGGHKREFGCTWVKLHTPAAAAARANKHCSAGIDNPLVNGTQMQQEAAAAAESAITAAATAGKGADILFDGIYEACVAEQRQLEAKQGTAARRQKNEGEMLVWMSHGDKVSCIPPHFEVLASTESCPFAAIGDGNRQFFALQFHPEVTHTPLGLLLLRNFAFKVAKLSPTWTMKNFMHAEVKRIRELVGDSGHLLAAVSGGVDSTVAAALAYKAVGSRFNALLIDTGLLRRNEAEETMQRLRACLPEASIDCVDASAAFFSALENVKDPEEKRRRIGALFIEQFEASVNARNIPTERSFLLQGTLYPDVIESCSYKGPSHTIKTHHNVGGLPEKMQMKVLEPLRELFKDEVRALGLELGLPREQVFRHPFPGPGLAVRIVGEVTKKRVSILQDADAIFIEEIRKADLYDKIAQAFVVLLPDAPSVGVMGDCRTYEWTCVLRAVESSDFMTADWSRIPFDVLAKISTRIINEVKGINRVALDISSKPPATIEWE